jgi:hypothetical protein
MSPKLFAVTSFRYDQQLVPDMIQNLNFVDGFILHDDRNNSDVWYHEGKQRNELINAARRAEADWVLCIDPDERFEQSAGDKIRKLIANTLDPKTIYGFKFRELFHPTRYRSDGVWGEKHKFVLFPLLPGQKHSNQRVHSQWAPTNPEYNKILTDINLYHLKMIDPLNRIARSKLYEELDPNNEYQSIGYSYLRDESNIILESIQPGREYFPAYSNKQEIVQIRQQN